VIAPRDALLFSEQNFAFTQANQDALLGLLNRGLGDDPVGSQSSGDVPARIWGGADGTLLNASDPFHASGAGLEVGGDVPVGSGRIGAAFAYENVNLSDDQGSSAGQDIVRVGVYGGQTFGSVIFSAAVAYAHGWDRTERASGLGLSAATRGTDAFTAGAQVSAPLTSGDFVLTPTGGLLVSNVSGEAFTETNGNLQAFAIHGDSSSVTTVVPYAQVSLSRAYTLSSGAVVTPDALVGYRYDGSANSGDVTLVAEDGTVFVGNRLSLNPNVAVLGAGISAHKSGLTGFIRYRATVSSNWYDQTLKAGLRWTF
jgi:outer membrane autotransporter protein